MLSCFKNIKKYDIEIGIHTFSFSMEELLLFFPLAVQHFAFNSFPYVLHSELYDQLTQLISLFENRTSILIDENNCKMFLQLAYALGNETLEYICLQAISGISDYFSFSFSSLTFCPVLLEQIDLIFENSSISLPKYYLACLSDLVFELILCNPETELINLCSRANPEILFPFQNFFFGNEFFIDNEISEQFYHFSKLIRSTEMLKYSSTLLRKNIPPNLSPNEMCQFILEPFELNDVQKLIPKIAEQIERVDIGYLTIIPLRHLYEIFSSEKLKVLNEDSLLSLVEKRASTDVFLPPNPKLEKRWEKKYEHGSPEEIERLRSEIAEIEKEIEEFSKREVEYGAEIRRYNEEAR
jgi:hypothetical protein